MEHLICQDMQMKVMSKRSYFDGDSEFHTRLLNSLNDSGRQLKKIENIRDNIYIIQTNNEKYLLKGFHNEKKLEAQKILTRKLKANGFTRTYDFIKDIPSFYYDGERYEWIEYLSGSRKSFSFNSSSNRSEGLDLLQDFHSATRRFYKSVPASSFNQLEKWEERKSDFEDNTKIVNRYASSKLIESWLEWADFSLKGLRKYEDYLYSEPKCIVHGDVAHHNFFRKSNGSLFLIDFDLISKAPPIIDYLQYSNRIMPHIQNSKQLWDFGQFRKYKDNPAFLYALTYPSDIFREWNRIIRTNSFRDNAYLHSVWKLSVEEWSTRKKLYKEISSLI